MDRKKDWSEVPVGRYLAEVREEAGMTQSTLSSKVTLSTATLSRIESGEKTATEDEVAAVLRAIGTPRAKGLSDYLKQNWDQIERPAFDHPDREVLWKANLTLRKIAELRSDPDIKSVFVRQMDLYEKEIRRLCDFLRSRDHQVAFIGVIGVGKTTAICKLANLIKTVEEELKKQVVLETGPGRTTLCEVHISHGPTYGLRITPRTESSIRKDVEDFATYLYQSARPDEATDSSREEEDGDTLGVATEVVRAIRNMSGLTTTRRKDENGKTVRIDQAKELALHHDTPQELAIQILTRMDLLRRNRRDTWYPGDCPHPPSQWLQQMYAEVNNGRHPEFTLPQKIEVIVPYPIFDSRDLPLRIIDTKGIDQTAQRQDLECHLDDPRTLVVFCSGFKEAPEVAIQTILHRAQQSGVKDVSLKTVLLVLPQENQATDAKYDDGAYVEDALEGYDLKREQIQMCLSQKGLADLTIEFFNSRDESPAKVRDGLVAKIVEQRKSYAAQLEQLAFAVDRLIENRQNEQVRLVFEHVSSDLGSWVDRNRTLSVNDDGVQEPLISQIDSTRYASTVRAAVRRYGDWYNLDYYHHLAFGVRLIAVNYIGGKIEQFRVIVNNLLGNEELAPANEFLERLLRSLDAAVDEAYKKLQTAGRETFKQTLEKDFTLWSECERRWGLGKINGRGYRDDVSSMTDGRFRSDYEEAHKLIVKLVNEEWEKIVVLLEGMLRETNIAPAA